MVSANTFLLALNTGTPEPSGYAPTLTCGVISLRVMTTFMFATNSVVFALVARSLFEFGQSPKAITEVFRGGHTLSRFPRVALARPALSEVALEVFGWLACAIRKFCSALDVIRCGFG